MFSGQQRPLKQNIEKHIIFSAQANVGPNYNFLQGLKKYADDVNAEIHVLPMYGKSVHEEKLSKAFQNMNVVYDKKFLNNKLQIENFAVKPQAIRPLSGLERFANYDISTIFASPKQFMKVVPNSVHDIPKILMTTGAVTMPNYSLQHRIGQIAERDHVFGAIIVEIENETDYHFRQIRASNSGRFSDLGIVYNGTEKPQFKRAGALVLGDWHEGETDPNVITATTGLIEQIKPRRLILHDLFNGHSVNHHEYGKVITQAKNYRNKNLNLEEELEQVYNRLVWFSEISKDAEIIIPACNHHDFLKKYLEQGRFIYEPQNTYISSKLLTKAIEGSDPVEEGIRMFGTLDSRIKFLSRHDDFKLYGYQLGVHGDKGPNGAWRAGVNALEKAYAKSITGHNHTPELMRDVVVVGTSTKTRLEYTEGPSSWMNTHAALYDTNKPQLINIIKGKYCA